MVGNSYRFALIGFAVVAGAFAALVPAAVSAAPTLLGNFGKWSAYTAGTGSDKVCNALAQPESSTPANLKRDPVFFLINDWPARHVDSEPEFVPGYSYKDGATVMVQIGSDKFAFFTKNDGGSGSAWAQQVSDEPRMADAMKRGSELIVIGNSARGTLTRDTFSLSGVTAALNKVHAACK